MCHRDHTFMMFTRKGVGESWNLSRVSVFYCFWTIDILFIFCGRHKWMTPYNDEWCKIWTEIDWSVQNCHEEFNDFWLQHSKISIICTLMGCFWPKYIMFELSKYRGAMFDDTHDWCRVWRKTDLCFQNWHEEFDKFSPQHIRKSKNWDFYWVLLSKVEDVWA